MIMSDLAGMHSADNTPVTHIALDSHQVGDGPGVWCSRRRFKHETPIFGMEGGDHGAARVGETDAQAYKGGRTRRPNCRPNL
jgi:hypothetical protein